MATVMIGDRELKVRRQTLGLAKDLVPSRRKMRAAQASDDDALRIDGIAEMIHCYVGEPLNAGIDLVWLMENLPADPSEIIRQCVAASGGKLAESQQGEAVRQ